MINLLSFFGYYITRLLHYFLVDIMCHHMFQLQEQQLENDGGTVMAVNHVTNCTDEQTMMIVGKLVNILLLFYLFIYRH